MHAHSSLLSTAIAGEGSGEARWMAAAMNKAGGKQGDNLEPSDSDRPSHGPRKKKLHGMRDVGQRHRRHITEN